MNAKKILGIELSSIIIQQDLQFDQRNQPFAAPPEQQVIQPVTAGARPKVEVSGYVHFSIK